jgi:hypothetical protein
MTLRSNEDMVRNFEILHLPALLSCIGVMTCRTILYVLRVSAAFSPQKRSSIRPFGPSSMPFPHMFRIAVDPWHSFRQFGRPTSMRPSEPDHPQQADMTDHSTIGGKYSVL